MRNFQGIFLIIYTYIFISKFKTDQWFSFMKLETFTNCKDGKYVIIMIFLILCDTCQELKITFRKSSAPRPNPQPPTPSPEKIYSLLFTHSPQKFKKGKTPPPPPFCQHWKFFRPPAEWGENMVTLVVWYWRYAN